MAVLWVEGFEQFSSSTGVGLLNTKLERKYSGASTDMGSNAEIVSGHGSTAALAGGTTGNLDILDKVLDSVENSLYVSFSLRYDNLGADPIQFLVFRTGASTQCVVRIFQDGTIDIRRGTGTIVDSTASGAFPMDQWVYVEVFVDISNTGSYDIRINGSSVLSGTGDIQDAGTSGADVVRFIFEDQVDGGLGSSGSMKVDNWVIQDSNGSFLLSDSNGSWYIEGIVPNGVGDSSQLTPTSGDNYTNVDEIPDDGDTSTVSSASAGDQDLYEYENLTAFASGGFSIKATQILSVAEQDGGESLISVVKSGTTTDKDTAQSLGTVYETLSRIVEDNPDTASAWTESEVNNAQFGVEVG